MISSLGESICAPSIFIPVLIGSLPILKSTIAFFILTAYTLSPALSVSLDAIISCKSLYPAFSASSTAFFTHSLSVLHSDIKVLYSSANVNTLFLSSSEYFFHAFFLSIMSTSFLYSQCYLTIRIFLIICIKAFACKL